MSVEHMALVLHHSRAKGTDKLVLLGIANHAGDGGAWPAVATLARYANVSERSVQRSLETLVGLGELHRDLQAGGTAASHRPDWSRPNLYEVLVRCPSTCDRTPQHRSYPQAPAKLSTDDDTPDSPESDRVTSTSPGDTGVTGGDDVGVTRTTTQNPRGPSSLSGPDRAREIRAELRRRRIAPDENRPKEEGES